MTLFALLSIIYVSLLVVVCIRILIVTQHSNKAMAYLLLVCFLPVIGMGIYFLFGVNYWKKKKYNKKLSTNRQLLDILRKNVVYYDESAVRNMDESVEQNSELASMLIRDIGSPLTRKNEVKVLLNGEEKFPMLLEAIKSAKHHIHIEYYIYEYDDIGSTIIELLIQKAREGVQVRLIYDDFGSPTINKKTERRMREAGAEVHPFHKVVLYLLANRINYRNHRKIVIIDGHTAFLGGINVSDKYINNGKHKLFWRDTHLRIHGPAVYYLQYLFIADWDFCCPNSLKPDLCYFPAKFSSAQDIFAQITASGPDSPLPSVLYSILQAIYLAKKEILIATPYFIPGDSIMDALSVAAQSGLIVKLLVPGISDSKIVNAASRSYYNKLLEAGVEVFLYQKGFIHAKTMVTDSLLCMVGTANMDLRSFELNFEVNAVIYDSEIATQMRTVFFDDLKDATQINKESWLSRPWYKQLPEKIARLFSPVM
jgi:cardiolipin synthase